MKLRNFPARKLLRQMNAQRDMSKPYTTDELKQLNEARDVRTKKRRASV